MPLDRWDQAELASLRGFLVLAGIRWHDAEECAQEAVCRLLESSVDLRDTPARTSWLRTTAIRIAIDRNRHERIESRKLPLLAPHTDSAQDRDVDLELDLLQLLRTLTPTQRRVIALHYLADWPTAQISEELGLSPVAVRVALSRARRKLRSSR
jgi:RNA polymerase sigma-70 factor (ECF subfamily)